LAYDGAATIYVAEGVEGQMGGLIQMFNTSGVTISAPITTYDGTHTFGQPDGVAYYGGNIYVVDQVNNSVYEINPSPVSLVGSPLTTWNSTGGSAPSSFSGPEGIAVDTNGNVYIADTGNDYVEVFNSSLSTTPVTEFGGSGSFNNPSAVAVDGSGNIYVADASNPQTSNNQRVQIFTSSYVLSRQFSIGANSDIYGITLNGGNIYLADSGTGQVEEYSPSGVFLTSGLGISPANSPSPDGLAFMGSNLLVADYSNDQLYLVTP
jgi:sugar lactone lactonase YvrE